MTTSYVGRFSRKLSQLTLACILAVYPIPYLRKTVSRKGPTWLFYRGESPGLSSLAASQFGRTEQLNMPMISNVLDSSPDFGSLSDRRVSVRRQRKTLTGESSQQREDVVWPTVTVGVVFVICRLSGTTGSGRPLALCWEIVTVTFSSN